MIKLIASDIDGTLVADGTADINPEIYEVISKLHDRGIAIAVATGRHWKSIDNLFTPIAKKIFYIADNGAYIGIKGRSLFLNGIPKQQALDFIKDVHRNKKLLPVIATKSSYFIDKNDDKFMSWIREGYQGEVEYIEDFSLLKEDILKIAVYCENIYNEVDYIIEKYAKELDLRYSGTMWLDCARKDVSKGFAIRILQESLGIKSEETLVFGDQCNDIDMLKSAYYSFAVSNAVDELKSVARFETKANVEDGVLDIMKMLL
mgnify:FL=1